MVKLFNLVRDSTTIPQWVEFEVVTNNKQKKVVQLGKLNDLLDFITKINFTFVINEEIFEQLPPNLQKLAIIEELTGISISESDAISVAPPDITTHSGVLSKFGSEEVLKLKESVKSLYDKKKQDEDEVKAQGKIKKTKKV